MEVIALTGPYPSGVKELLAELAPSGFEVRTIATTQDFEKLQDANYIILRTLSLDEQIINSLPNLKFIQRWGVGYDTVDIQAAGKRNIPVAITTGINAAPVSEMAVLLMLATYRNLIQLFNNVQAGKWREGASANAYVINGKTVGLVGMGNIGKQVAKKVQAFGADVKYYDAFRLSPEEEAKLGVTYVEMEELLKTTDIISLHVPLTDDTRHLICTATIELMKPSAIIINTARGEIISEADLVVALQNNRIMGAGLDVVEHEPASKDNPLLTLKNVVVTPHMGAATSDISVSMAKRCMENIIKVSKGESLGTSDVVNAPFLINSKF